MEGRGRLAQSLTLKRRASFALWTRSYEPRWFRGARRHVVSLVLGGPAERGRQHHRSHRDAELAGDVRRAVGAFADEVRRGAYPDDAHSF